MADIDAPIAVGSQRRTVARYSLRFVVLGYLAVLLAVPVGVVFYRSFRHGLGPVWSSLTTADARSAIYVTLIVAVAAVVLNTIFGVGAALLLVRKQFPGRRLLDVLVDLPQAVSPIVAGLALVLVYGKFGFFGGWLQRHGIQLIFSLPGMVMATAFVSLPLVVRAVAPVLAESGDEQEQAARTLGASGWQTFRRITLPSIDRQNAHAPRYFSTRRTFAPTGKLATVPWFKFSVASVTAMRRQSRFAVPNSSVSLV